MMSFENNSDQEAMEAQICHVYANGGFDFKHYLDENYSAKALQEDNFTKIILDEFHEIFKTETISGPLQLEFGSGPCINNVISSSQHCSHIVCTEYSLPLRVELERWLHHDPAAHDWKPWLHYAAGLENRQVEEVEGRIRASIKQVTTCNVYDDVILPAEVSGPYDVITSTLCLESACSSVPMYQEAVKKLSSYHRPGGLLVLAGVLDESFYYIKGVRLHSLKQNEDDIERALNEANYSDVNWKIHRHGDSDLDSAEKQSDGFGFFVLSARKK